MAKIKNITSIPSGYKLYKTSEGRFADWIGPYFLKNKFPNTIFGTRINEKQSNLNDVSHGGFLMAFADTIGGYFSFKTVMKPIVTVTLSSMFIRPVPINSWLVGKGKVKKYGKRTIFVEIQMYTKKNLVFMANGTWQIINIAKE